MTCRRKFGSNWIDHAISCIIGLMRIDEISVFVRVLEAGSFAGAARRLSMPATTVSAKIAALERRLGITLIQRTTRKLRVTPAGQAYFERCRAGLREIEAAEAAVLAEAGGLTGTLRLTASIDTAQALMPPIIAAFREAHPTVAVELIATDAVIDLVEDGIDLAIRVGPLRDSSMVARAFVTGPSGLYASQRYLERRGVPQSVDDLRHHELIGLNKPWARPLSMLWENRNVTIDLTGDLACDDLLTLRSFMTMGLGISFLPGYIAQQAELVRVLPELQSLWTGLYFAYPSQKFVPARVRAFIPFAVSTARRLRLQS